MRWNEILGDGFWAILGKWRRGAVTGIRKMEGKRVKKKLGEGV